MASAAFRRAASRVLGGGGEVALGLGDVLGHLLVVVAELLQLGEGELHGGGVGGDLVHRVGHGAQVGDAAGVGLVLGGLLQVTTPALMTWTMALHSVIFFCPQPAVAAATRATTRGAWGRRMVLRALPV